MTTPENRDAWIAGILEGEGCFLISWKKNKHGRAYPTYRIACHMCDGDVVEKLFEWAGVGTFGGPYKLKNIRHKPYYRWTLNRRADVTSLLLRIRPYMGIRRGRRIDEILASISRSGRSKWRHGTRHGYDHRGCRCEPCTKANTDHLKKYWRKRGRSEWKPAQHGTRSKYVGGCRCAPCRTANRDYQRAA
jgi:hypothetical protein